MTKNHVFHFTNICFWKHEGTGAPLSPLNISEADPSYPREEPWFSLFLFAISFSSSHYPKLMATGEGRNLDQPNWKLRLLAQCPLHHDGPAQCLECCWCPKKTLLAKTPRYFSSFVWGGGSSPNRMGQSIILQHGTVASDLEVLTLVAVSLHSVANHLGALMDRRSRQNRVICKKQRCHSNIRRPNILLTTAASSGSRPSMSVTHHPVFC